MKKEIKVILSLIFVEVVAIVSITFLCVKYHEQKKLIDKQEHAIITIESQNFEKPLFSRYNFIDYEKAVYIEQLCIELDIDPDIAFGILMTENETFNPDAIHRNDNGTIDVGLFQLNDYYLWTTFKKDYWFDDIELDPFNWKHNTYIALHHIAFLQNKLKIIDDIIMGYNGGYYAVMNGTVKDSTRNYLAKVKNNIWLLKNCKTE